MKQLITFILAFYAFYAQAQISGTDVFLQGNHVEVGAGHLGYYGSDGTAPTGYHPHCTGCAGGLGFVADPYLTGWDTSTTTDTSHYYGDYFLPGSPFEGWELQESGMRVQAFNTSGSGSAFVYNGGMPTCTGGFTSYGSSGGVDTAVWQGSVDSITITQITYVDTAALYFTTKVTLTNTASSPKNNLYYLRSLDPDNDESWTGNFGTTNTIVSQMPCGSCGASVVSATGIVIPECYMSLGSADTASRVFIYGGWPLMETIDLSTVYGETYTTSGAWYTAGTTNTADYGIGLVISIPHLATVDSAADSVLRTTGSSSLHPANSESFTFFYAFRPDATDSAIAHTIDTAHVPTGALGIQNVNNTPAVNVYPNPARSRVNISGLNTGDLLNMYDMMGRDVIENQAVMQQGITTVSLNGLPAGAYLLTVTDANGNVRARVPVQKQ